jgi:trans-aconitate 2-methyltransferase
MMVSHTAMPDAWDPAQYERFKREREAPLRDLLALVATDGPGVESAVDLAVDLGCGTGEGTRLLHERVRPRATIGVDTSLAMLEQARARVRLAGVRFVAAHAERSGEWITAGAQLGVVFSNACLHWVEDHVRLFTSLWQRLAPDGQLAVQMPINGDHPSHVVARALAERAPYAAHLRHAALRAPSPVLPPEQYARLLHRLGAASQRVFVEVYGHELPSRDDVVEWVKGSLLTEPKALLPRPLYEAFLSD